MTRTPLALSCLFALVSVVGCSRADAASSESTIAMRHAADRTPLAEQAERLAVRACECEDSSCATEVGEEFVALRQTADVQPSDEDAIGRVAERIRNCQVIVANGG